MRKEENYSFRHRITIVPNMSSPAVRLVPVGDKVAAALCEMLAEGGGGVTIRPSVPKEDGFGNVPLVVQGSSIRFPCCAALMMSNGGSQSRFEHSQLVVPMIQSAASPEQQLRVVADDHGRAIIVAESVEALRFFLRDPCNGYSVPAQQKSSSSGRLSSAFDRKCEELIARGIEATQAILATVDVGRLANIESELEAELNAKGKKALQGKSVIVSVDGATYVGKNGEPGVFAEITFA